MPEPLVIAETGAAEPALLSATANRHSFIAGAIDTGKTVPLRVPPGRSRASACAADAVE